MTALFLDTVWDTVKFVVIFGCLLLAMWGSKYL